MFHEKQCTRCGDCLVRCQYFDYDQEEAIKQIERLIAGGSSEVLKKCVTCAACNNYCPEGLRPYELILQRISERDDKKPAMLPYFINGMPAPTLFQDVYGSLSYGEQEILRRWSETPPASSDVLFVGSIGIPNSILCFDS